MVESFTVEWGMMINSSFQQVINRFITRIESLKFSFQLIVNIIELNQKNAEQEFIGFTSPFLSQEQTETALKISLEMPYEKLLDFKVLGKKAFQYSISSPVIKRNFIISLVSEFDIHLSLLIRTMFCVKPETIHVSDKQLSFKQLLTFDSMDSAKEYLIEKEIESVLRESHNEHFKWLENRLGMKSLRNFDTPAWENFIEITERRNLFVHCDGIISNQYINVCTENKINLSNSKVGDQLDVSEEYFDKAYYCFFEVGVKLAHTIWRKIKPEEREIADETLNNLCLQLIIEEEYNLSNILLDFARSEPIIKNSSQQSKLLLLLNKAQCLKWTGDAKEYRNLLLQQDWSACCDEFKLARSILLDEYDESYKLMKLIGNNPEKISMIHYREWPVFKEFRKTEQFLKAYQEIFNETFDLKPAPSSFTNTESNNKN